MAPPKKAARAAERAKRNGSAWKHRGVQLALLVGLAALACVLSVKGWLAQSTSPSSVVRILHDMPDEVVSTTAAGPQDRGALPSTGSPLAGVEAVAGSSALRADASQGMPLTDGGGKQATGISPVAKTATRTTTVVPQSTKKSDSSKQSPEQKGRTTMVPQSTKKSDSSKQSPGQKGSGAFYEPPHAIQLKRPKEGKYICNDGYKHVPCFDVEACGADAPRGGKYALVLAQLGLPKWPWLTNIENMQAQADFLTRTANASVDIVLLIPTSNVTRLGCRHKQLIQRFGIKLFKVDWALPPGMRWIPWYWQAHTWCGPMDLIRLHALGMEGYDAVAYYDQDIEFQGSIEPVMRCAAAGHFLSTSGGVEEPLNIGFFALRPDRRYLQAAIHFAQNASYDDNTGWGESGFAPAGGGFVGSQCGQGFLHTLMYKNSAPVLNALKAAGIADGEVRAKQIDRCLWNYQTHHQCPEKLDCRSVQVHHKPTGKPQGNDCGKLPRRAGKEAYPQPPQSSSSGEECTSECVKVGANCKCNSPDGHVKILEVNGIVESCEKKAFNPAGDTFAATFSGSKITITRTDSRSCWCDSELFVLCCIRRTSANGPMQEQEQV